MHEMIWQPLCPLCEHPARAFSKTTQTTVTLTMQSDGPVHMAYGDLVLDVIGDGLQPADVTCAICHYITT